MSTRCTINFGEDGQTTAKVYKHHDGYTDGPNGTPATLRKFFAAVKADTADTRFGHASYLAAKFVVFYAGEVARDSEMYANGMNAEHEYTPVAHASRPLDFLGIGILDENPGDIEFEYFVDCGKFDADGCPVVTYRGAGEDASERRPVPVAA